MSTDMKTSKARLTKIIQSDGFLGKTLGNVTGNLVKKKALIDFVILLTKDVLHKLAT